MSTAIARSVDVTNFDTLERLSNLLAKAADACPKAFFGKPATVAAVILFGQEVGLTPMMALRSVHVIEGKMTLSAELMLTLALQRGVTKTWPEDTNQAATIVLSRNGVTFEPERFTMEDAKTADLLGKTNWKRYPRNMMRARAIANAIRKHCPDVLGPCIYSEEEMRDLEESAPPPTRREASVATLTRPAVDGQASIAPAGVFLGDLTDAPDSGMRGEETLSAIRHCTTPEKLFAWLEARSRYIRKSEGEVREHITSVLTKMSKRASLELPIVLDRAGLVEASKSIYTGTVIDTTAQRLQDNLEAGEDAIRDEQEGDGPH